MRRLLELHPESSCPPGIQIAVEVSRPHSYSLVLVYVLRGNIDELNIPTLQPPVRGDQLWRTTCLEVFIRSAGAQYCEFNFAPSTKWAAYQFEGYRGGKRPIDISAPSIEVQSSSKRFTLKASLQLDSMSSLLGPASWRLGLSALVEERNGNKSYWAVVHPPGRPDFHHIDGFAHVLLPAVQE
jgi:hypothetical protein